MNTKTRADSSKISPNDMREPSPASRWWNFSENENERILRIDGAIAEESWLDDDVTPKIFRDELYSANGSVEIWLNSAGGDVFAAAQIYNMLMDYKGDVTVKIDGLAASAASVIAMAGSKVLMSPVSQIMIHNPATIAIGDSEEMSKAISMLSEIKESIINAYELKTGLSRAKISHMMDAESWMNAHKAVELGFADDILFTDDENKKKSRCDALIFSRMAVTNSILGKLKRDKTKNKTNLESLERRLDLLNH